MLQMWNSGWTVQFLVCRNGRSNSEWRSAHMWGITAPSVQWLWIQFGWQSVLCLCHIISCIAVLDTVNTFKLCRGCTCVQGPTHGVGTRRGLHTQGCIDSITAVSVAAAGRSRGVCVWYCTSAMQFRGPATNAAVLLLSLPMSSTSLIINLVLIMPRGIKGRSPGASKETTYTVHAFLEVGKKPIVK